MIRPECGEESLGSRWVPDQVGWNISVEVVAVEVQGLEVGKAREGGRDLLREVIIGEAENGEGVKCSELSRERAFEAIFFKVKFLEGGESASLRGQVAANLIVLKVQVDKAIERPYLRRYGAA